MNLLNEYKHNLPTLPIHSNSSNNGIAVILIEEDFTFLHFGASLRVDISTHGHRDKRVQVHT